MIKVIKKNQIIIYVFVLMLITAGYLNYTTNSNDGTLETSLQIGVKDDIQISDIGDAQLVSSSDIIEDEPDLEETENDLETVIEEIEDEKYLEVIETEETEETSNSNEEVISVEEYFSKSKLERENMYSEILETYENILNSDNTSETQRQSATEEISKINDIKNKIMITENLIGLKGFENNIVFVNENSINVVVQTQEIKQEEIAQIQNIVSRELLTGVENIHITNKI